MASSTSSTTGTSAIAIPRSRGGQKHSASANPTTTAMTVGVGSFEYGSFGSVSGEDEGVGRLPKSGRRASLMSPAFSHAEHTVINVGGSETPRLITCVKASQGFDWNQEIFLPSYANFDFDDLERRQDPVQEIVVTDEEREKMFPS